MIEKRVYDGFQEIRFVRLKTKKLPQISLLYLRVVTFNAIAQLFLSISFILYQDETVAIENQLVRVLLCKIQNFLTVSFSVPVIV